MTTSLTTSDGGKPLRLQLDSDATTFVQGAWWPWSRSLQAEAAALVDHFPSEVGHISRLLYSRPDWDDGGAQGRGVHRIHSRRGPVKVGSFPSDDTHLMVLTMSTGRRLRLIVVPSDIDQAEGDRRMTLFADGAPAGTDDEWARWDNEAPSR